MKNSILILLIFALFSCRRKEPTPSDFKQMVLTSVEYKIVLSNFKGVQDSLEMMKKRPVDTNSVKYQYNTIIGNKTIQAKTMVQVVKEMDKMSKDSSFLKNVQRHLADTLAKNYRDSVSKSKN